VFPGNSISNAELVNSSVTVTAGSGLINGGSVSFGGSTTLDIGAGTGITVNANDVAIDQSFAPTWTGVHTFTQTVTNTGFLTDFNLTLGNDADADTVSAINIDVTSAATADADLVYGINIADLTTASAVVTETALRFGANWENVIDDNGTLISATELNLLDGHDVALVDTNDAVSTAIIGTGALNSGSITSGFGAIDVGADGITTSGTIGTAATTAFTGATGVFSTSVTSPTHTGTGAVTLSSGGASALTLDSASNILVIAANDTTLQRTAAGTYTINLVDGSDTTLALTNSGAGNAILQVDNLAGSGTRCLQTDNSGNITKAASGCGAGSTSLQNAYDAGNTIETSSNNPVIITETTAASNTGDLLQLTNNAATGGTTSGDALQITLDAADADGNTGNGIFITIDQSQNTGNAILVKDDGANELFKLNEDGALTLGTVGATTALTVTDTDYTNALSIGDNNIIGTTAAIDFTNFDVATNGNITVAAGQGITTNGAGALKLGTATATSIDVGSSSVTGVTITTDGTGDAELTVPGNSISNTELVNSSVTVTAGSGLINGGSVSLGGSTTLDIGAGTGITVNANDVAIDQSFAFAWTGLQTHTNTLTASSTQEAYNLTLGNDGDADTISAIQLNVTSANTADADQIYALDITNLTTPDATVLESAIHIGSGWDNVIDDNGTLISATELNRLDGKDAALVDVNDAVVTAITGTGALDSGSITSGFGSIDTGTDNITTTGTVSGNSLTRSSAGLLSIGTTNATSITIGSSSVTGVTITTDGTGDAELTVPGNSISNTELVNSSVTVTAGSGLINGGSVSLGGSTTLDIGAGTGITVNANDVAIDQSFAPTWTGVHTFTQTVTNTGFLTDFNLTLGNDGDADTVSAINIDVTSAATADADLVYGINIADLTTASAVVTETALRFGANWENVIDDNGTLISATELNRLDGKDAALVDVNDAVSTAITGTGALDSGSITSGFGSIDTGTDNISTTGTVSGNSLTRSSAGLLSLGTTNATSITIGSSSVTGVTITTDGTGDAELTVPGNSISNTELVNSSVTVTAGSGLINGGSVSLGGSTTLDIGAGTGITVNANDVAIDQSFAPTWTGVHTFTQTVTNTGFLTDFNLTLGNDGDADTVSAINIDVTSAATADADLVYGINIADLTTASAVVTETALRFGANWENVIDDNGTLISATELNLLDGHDVALVDTNDAVSTAIIGTGALNSGSITSGFGAIDVGADGITTSGTIGTAATTAFTGATGVFSTSVTSPTHTGTGAVTLSSGGASALTLDSASNILVIAANDTTLQRTAAGTYTINLVDGSDTTLALTNSGAGNAILQVDNLAGSGTRCLQTDNSGNITKAASGCGAGSTSLQNAYDAGNTIETSSNNPVIITETTAASNTGDLLQLTNNAATGGTTSGDALQITLDAADADGNTGNGIFITIDQSQNTGNAILVKDDGANELFKLNEDGALTLGTVGATTALTVTDTDYTNALSIGDNNIIGTTAAIDFTNFDVATNGNITVAAGQGITTNGAGALKLGTATATSIDVGSSSVTGVTITTDGTGDAELTVPGNSISNTELVNSSVTVTAGSGLINGGSVSLGGSTTLDIGAGTGITVNANDVAIDQSFAFAWTGLQTHTNTLTASSTQEAYNLTLGNDGDADTISAIQLNVTSANTADADQIYALDITNLTTPDATVLESAIHIGSGWDNVIDDNGTLISATELNRLDGKDAALVDVNDAVVTAITGTGALDSGSITSGFGSIDTGTDNITTTGTVSGNSLTRSSAGLLSIGTTNATSITIGSSSVTGVTITTDGTGDAELTVPGNSISNTELVNSSVTVTAGSGLINGGSVSLGGSTTLDIGAGTGITVNANDVAIDQSFAPTWTGVHTFTQTVTNTGFLTDFNLTLGNDGDADTVSAINIDVTSAATADADLVYGINIADLTTASAVVTETALRFGANWENVIDDNGTLISATELNVLDGGIDESEVTGVITAVVAGNGLINGGASGSVTLDVAAADSTITVAADSIAVNQTFAFAWTGLQTHTNTLTASSTQEAYNLTLGNDGDADTISAIQLNVTSANTADADQIYALDITNLTTPDATVLESAIHIGSGWDNVIDDNGTLISATELNRLDGKDAALVDVNDAVSTAITGTGALDSGSITSGFGSIDTGTDNISTTGTVSGNSLTRSSAGLLSLGTTNATSITIGSSSVTGVTITTDGTGDAELTVPGNSISNTELVNSSVTVTAGSGLINGGSVSLGGSTTLDIGAGTGITVNANDVAIDQSFAPTWTGVHTFTQTVTNTGFLTDFNLTLGNDGDADTVSAINIDVTSAATADADLVYGINIADLTTASAVVTETALRFGANWENVIDDNGTLISATELNVLDGGIDESEVTGVITAVVAGNGLINGGASGSVTLDVAAADSTITVAADSIAVNQTFAFAWTGLQTHTATITNSGSLSTFTPTLGNDADADTIAGITISPVSVDTGADGDVVIGLDISNLSGGNANVAERGIHIGTGYDSALVIGALSIFDGSGVLSTSTSVVTGSYTGITGVGALDAGSITANFGAINVGADGITTSGTIGTAATTTFTGNGATFTGAIAANGSITSSQATLVINASGNVDVQDALNADSITSDAGVSIAAGNAYTSAGAVTLSSGAGGAVTITPNGSGDTVVSIDADTNLQITASAAPGVDMVAITDGGNHSTTTGVDGISLTFGPSNASGDALHIVPSYAGGATDTLTYNVIETDPFTPTNASGLDSINGIMIGALTQGGDAARLTATALNIGSGWDNVLSVNGTAILNATGVIQTAGVSGSYTGITGVGALDAGSITANFGAIDVGADGITTSGTIGTASTTTFTGATGTFSTSVTSALFTNAGALSISTTASNGAISFSPNGSGDVTLTADNDTQLSVSGTVTDTGEATRIAVTLGNDADTDTVSGLTIAPVSVDTGADADVLRGLDIANLSGGNANVTEQGIHVGTGYDSALAIGALSIFDGSGVLSTSTSVVTGSYTGITGVGALDAGSITANFGAINVGADGITTSGTIGTAATTSFTGATGVFSTSVTTPSILTAGGANLSVTPNGAGDIVFNVDADTNIQVTAGGVPAADMITVTNSGQVVTTDGVDGLQIDFRTGDGTNPVNSAINLLLTSGGAQVGDVLNGLNVSSVTTSSGATTNGINITGVTSNGTDTGLVIGAGWDTGLAISQNTNGKGITVTATGVPTADQVQITNAGQAITTANVNGLSINYTGGAAAVESAGQRIDLTPGTTAAGTWSGLRIVDNATGPVAQVIENSIKLEGPTSISNGGLANGIEIKNPKYTAAINVEEASSGIVMNSPFGGVGRYENYVTRSEEFNNADWTKEDTGGGAGVTVTADNTTGPGDNNSATTADKLADNANGGTRAYQTITSGNSVTWTFSVWIKNNDATTSFKIGLFDNTLAGASDVNTITVASPTTDNWQRYSVTHTTAGSGVSNVVPAIDVNQGNSTRSIYIWGAQLEKQTSPGVYVKTMTSALAFSGSNGLVVDSNLNNSTSSGFVYANRLINRVVSGTAGTHEGLFVRIQDDTSLTTNQVVKGLDVQAWNGSNTGGTNIGLDAYGKTFGVAGTTDALASSVSSPAAVFAYLQNTSATSTGNAIRAYSDKATGATLVSVYHESSHFTGTGLMIDLGNVGTGSGDFASGNFVSLKNSGTQKFHINSAGNVFATLNSSSANALCHSSSGTATDEEITDCSGAPVADYAEQYPVATGITYGDIVSIGSQNVVTTDGLLIKQLVKSTKAYDSSVIGIVSDNHGDFTSAGYNISDTDNPMPVALNGRVPVKFSSENGPVVAGDYVTTSAAQPGYAMKATAPGFVIGKVLEIQSDGQALVFVEQGYMDPTTSISASGDVAMQHFGSSVFETTSDAAAVLVNQKGSGDLLQLQSNGVDKLLVKNNGELNINVTPADATANLVVVKSNDAEVFTINARGQLAITGNIIVKDDTFAGSIATNTDGEAHIAFTYDLGTGKPDVQLTVEGEVPAFAQVGSWDKNTDGNYTGFTIKTFAPAGGPASVIVHYLVIGKEPAYETFGSVMQVVTTPTPPGTGVQGTGSAENTPPPTDTVAPPSETPPVEVTPPLVDTSVPPTTETSTPTETPTEQITP
jgi:hypothetical protein